MNSPQVVSGARGSAESGGVRFAFILHPLTVDYLARHPRYRWTRHLPRRLVEVSAAFMPAQCVGTVRGGRSRATGQPVDGLIYALGATPRQMLTRPPEFTYRRLNAAIDDAARRGAKIVGLGAFTKVVGDAGVTVARRAPIPVTTGNSLTIAATLETAKLAAIRLGWASLARGKVMVVGATGSIGSVCSRLLAAAVKDVVLVSIEPPRLEELKRAILAETPDAQIETDVTTARRVGECDLIVTATSAFGQRVIDASQCKPGAVILDVALPTCWWSRAAKC
jgi:predicted amino acid dehydrogenase